MNGAEADWEEIDLEADGPDDEPEFRDWYTRVADTTGLDPNPDDPRHMYDYRAAFRAGVEPEYNEEDGKYHWDSRFKSDDHPNRFVGGIDTKTGEPAPAETPAAKKEAPAEEEWETLDLNAPDEGEEAFTPPIPGGMKSLHNLAKRRKKPAMTPEQEAAAALKAAEKKAQQERQNEEASNYMRIVAHGAIPDSWLESDTVKDALSGAAMDRAGMLWEKRRQAMVAGKDLTPEELKYLDILDKVMGYNSTEEGLSSMLPAAGELIGQQVNQLMDDQMNPYLTGGYAALAAGVVGAGVAAGVVSGPLAPITIPAAMAAAGGMAMRMQYYRRSKAVEGGLAFKELMEEDTENKWDVQTKAVAADIIGAIDGAFEMVGFEAALKLVPGLKGVTKGGIRPFVKSSKILREKILEAAKDYIIGVGGETGTEVMQELPGIITKAIMNNENVIEALGSEETADQLKEVAKKVASGMALLGVGGPAIHVGRSVKSVKDAQKFTEILLPIYEKTADAMEAGLETGAISVNEIQSTLNKAREQWPDNPIIPRMEEMILAAGGELEVAGPSTYTAATPEDLATLKSYLSVHLKDALPAGEEVAVSEARGGEGMGMVQQIGQALGAKVVFFKGEGASNSFNGLYDEGSNTVFINENSADPFAVVLGHETLHQIKSEAPDLYGKIATLIQGNEVGFDAWLAKQNDIRKEAGVQELTREEALTREEFIADFAGSQFKEKAFWEKVNAADPTLGQKLARYVFDLVEKIKSALGLRKDSADKEFVKELDQVQDALAGVYVEFARRKTVVDQTVQPVEKTVGQKVVEAVGTALSPAAAEAKTIGTKVTTKVTPSQASPVVAGEGSEWQDIDLEAPAEEPAEKPAKKKMTPQQEFDHLWGNLPAAEKKRLADLPTDDEMSSAEKVGLLKAEIASQAKKAKKAKKATAPEAQGEEISEGPVGEPGKTEELKASIADDSERLLSEVSAYRKANKGAVVVPDELLDAWDYIKTQVHQGMVERGGREPGLNHIVGTTYPKWFGMKGGQWSRKEFDAIVRNVETGKKLTFKQYWRFRELIDVMLEVQDTDPEMARMRDAQETIKNLEDEGWQVVMDRQVAGDFLEGQEVQIDGKRYQQAGWTSDGFILLQGKEDLKLEPFDQVFVEGVRGGKPEAESQMRASLKRKDVEIEVTAMDAEGNIARVKSKASEAIAENDKQMDFAERLLECLNS